MRNILSFENLVALLKCVPLYPNQIWYIYAFRTVRFHTDSQLFTPSEDEEEPDDGLLEIEFIYD